MVGILPGKMQAPVSHTAHMSRYQIQYYLSRSDLHTAAVLVQITVSMSGQRWYVDFAYHLVMQLADWWTTSCPTVLSHCDSLAAVESSTDVNHVLHTCAVQKFPAGGLSVLARLYSQNLHTTRGSTDCANDTGRQSLLQEAQQLVMQARQATHVAVACILCICYGIKLGG